MDWVLKQLDSLQMKIQASRASSSATSSVTFPFERPQRINDNVYQVHKPAGRPSVEMVFFHGLQLEGSKEAYLTTWLSEAGSELWLTWILKEFPDARILLVSYDASAQRKDDQGLLDMYLTCENLVQNLTEGRALVGGDGNPVILVGHSVGGLVIKELCVALHSTISKVLPYRKEGVENLLQNVKGIFYYACPHHGSKLADTSSEFPKGPLFECITTLNKETQRKNEEFRMLRTRYGWKTYGIVEGRPASLGNYRDFIVAEASARWDVDGFYTYDADHFNISRPRSTDSTNFRLLSNFIAAVVEQDQDRHSPKICIRAGVYGLEGRVNAVMDRLKGARRLGIVGIGGIGKTTLARAVYDAISGGFQYTCFLREVKKSITNNDDLEHLRNEIIKSLYNGGKVSDSFNWKTLKGKKVFIVLDDAECEAQVQVMLESDGFSDDSRVMVTARDGGFLYAEDFECYSVEQLDMEDSKKVLCLNAFRKEVPEPDYKYLVAQFAKKCGGLPLALRVAGKYLCGKEKGVWDDGLEKLKQAKSLNGSKKDGLWSILMMCYESLAEVEQEMFLDIATCFHNQDLETVKRAWSVCGWASPESGLKNLVDKGCVTIEETIFIEDSLGPRESHIVRMHEVLRDLGRSIACPNNGNVATHSRLCYDLSNPLLTTQLFDEEKPQVKVLIIHRNEDVSIQSLHELKQLRVLWLEDVSLHGQLSLLPSNLTYMKVSDSTLSIEPEGSHSSFAEASLGREKKRRRSGDHSALKRLEINACKLLEGSLDSLGQHEALEHLEISALSNWTAMPESFGRLRALKELTVVSCDQLRFIPYSLGHLLALKHLVIQDCQKIKAIPESLGRLQALEHLVVSCGCFKAPPNVLMQLWDLRHFETTHCQNWKRLLDEFGWLKALDKIVIYRCMRHGYPVIDQLQLLASLARKSLLQGVGKVHLPMFDEDNVQIIAWDSELLPSNFVGPGRARSLLIENCLRLEALPNTLGTLQMLKDLKIVNCGGLESLPDSIGDLKALQSLSITSCDSLKSLPDTIGNLQALTHLRISCSSSEAPPNDLQQPKTLSVEMTWCCCRHRTLLDTIAQLDRLQTFVIHNCKHYPRRDAANQIDFLDSLTRTAILQSSVQVDLPMFHDDDMEIDGCKLEQLPSHLFRLAQPSTIFIKNCENLKALPYSFWELRALRELDIFECRLLHSLPDELGKLEALVSLSIMNCRSLGALPDSLGELRALKTLDIIRCELLKSLPDELGKLEALVSLSIDDCPSLGALPDSLGELRALQNLHIGNCKLLRSLPDELGKLEALVSLNINNCPSLRALPDSLGELRALKNLDISSCELLMSLPEELGKLEALESLRIMFCPSLRALPDSLELRALQNLDINYMDSDSALWCSAISIVGQDKEGDHY